MNNLTQNELNIIEIMRDLKPFEVVEIRKDNNGIPDSYIVRREQKIHFVKLGKKHLTNNLP